MGIGAGVYVLENAMTNEELKEWRKHLELTQPQMANTHLIEDQATEVLIRRKRSDSLKSALVKVQDSLPCKAPESLIPSQSLPPNHPR